MSGPNAPAGEDRILGIDIGGTTTAVVVGTDRGQVLERDTFDSRASRGFEPMFKDLCEHARAMLAQHPEVSAVSVSVGGPMDSRTGVVHGPPNLPGWNNIELRRLLFEALGKPTYVEHDAKTSALAEWMFGAGRGTQNLVFLTLGTGLGAGIIVDGHLLHGFHNAAGEVGHWRIAPVGPHVYGKSGSWEGCSSGVGLPQLALHLFPASFPKDITTPQLAQRAVEGDDRAREVIVRGGQELGRGMALLVDLLAPEMIVLGGLARRLGEVFVAPAVKMLKAEALPALVDRCRVTESALGESLAEVSSLCAALYHRPRGLKAH